jgi:RHS repeat-associated protein
VTTGIEQASLSNGFNIVTASAAPSISDFNPKSAPIGTLITVTGTNFAPAGVAPQIVVAKQGGGTLSPPLSSFTNTSLTFVMPAGADSGLLTVTVNGQSATSAGPLTIVPSSNFTLTALPASANLIRGQNVAYAIQMTSANGFNQLAQLSVNGLPAGVTASFKPSTMTGGQTSVLTLTASANQPLGPATLSITATATVGGLPITQGAPVSVSVVAPSTTLLGRTVVSDALESPLAGVRITTLGQDGSGNTTGCTGQTATSDPAGNFILANLPTQCTGPQLIGFDGTTATAPPGKYAGVNLVFTLVAGQVTVSPVLVHLPRIDNVETFQVKQSSLSNQSYSFLSIPGLSVTVYAGTTFTMPDGTKPDPFPLAAVQVPVDRLPDAKPNVPTMIRSFIVAFQPANANTNQPVAVYFPNTLNTPPGTNMALMTLDPTRGTMVPYGTGAVSPDGSQIVPDPDPAHPGHLYGLVHFDWHGPMPPPAPGPNPGPDPSCPSCCSPASPTPSPGPLGPNDPTGPLDPSGPEAGDPVDLSSGLQVVRALDIIIHGQRGSILINRVYRTLSSNPGPFGIGTSHNYGYQLGTGAYVKGQGLILLVTPNGNQYSFNLRPNGTLANATIPVFRGAAITPEPNGSYTLRLRNGTTFVFQSPASGSLVAYLSGISDANGNKVTLAHDNTSSPDLVTRVVDPVGRALTLAYDTAGRITSITDPIGRTVTYTYNTQGTLATVTDTAGGVTRYAYDTQNRLTQITDARGTVVAQNIYDVNGRVIQQIQADGGVIKFAYTLVNPLAPSSPVMTTAVTDPLGNTTTYRFDPSGFLLDVTDAAGQTRRFTRDPQHNNLVVTSTGAASCPVCSMPQAGDQAFTYDSNGNTATKTDALGNTTTRVNEPAFNRVIATTNPLGKVTRYTYDAHGNMLTRTDPNGNTTSYSYNSYGQLILITDSGGQITHLSYDDFGNLTNVTDPLGNTTSLIYDAVSRPIVIVDPLKRRTTMVYDTLNRVVKQVNPAGNSIQYAYDAVGNLISATDENQRTTSYSYDPMRRLKTRTDPYGKTDTWTRDLGGNLGKFVDRRGQTTNFSYDVLNRLVGETGQEGDHSAASYDANGRLAEVVDSVSGTFDYTYDTAGRVTSSTSQFGTVKYEYDGAGRVISREVVGQPAVTYSYDNYGNLLSASLPQATAQFAYDARNQLLSISRSNGVGSQYSYDPAGRLLVLTHSGGQGVQIPLAYSYDAANEASVFATSVLQPQPVSNSYDTGGRLIQSGGTTYTYDENGNLASAAGAMGTTTYTWDSRNRLQSISAPNGQRTSLLYDFAGSLIAQIDSGPSLNLTQTFILDRANVAYITRSNGDSVLVLAGRRLDQHLAVVHANGQAEFGLADSMKSTIATADQSGKIVSSFSYEPFGKTATTSSYPFQFSGRVPLTGSLHYFRARCLDAAVGRFISEDPTGLFRGGKTYVYAGNSPFTFSDPAGLQNVPPKATNPPPSPMCYRFDEPPLLSGLLACLYCQLGLFTRVATGPNSVGEFLAGGGCGGCQLPGLIYTQCGTGPSPEPIPICSEGDSGDFVSVPCNPDPICSEPNEPNYSPWPNGPLSSGGQ